MSAGTKAPANASTHGVHPDERTTTSAQTSVEPSHLFTREYYAGHACRIRAVVIAREHTVAIVTLATILVVVTVYRFSSDPLKSDFEAFYRSGESYLAGAPLYAVSDSSGASLSRPDATRPILYPPILTVVVFAPLAAALSMKSAALAWSVI